MVFNISATLKLGQAKAIHTLTPSSTFVKVYPTLKNQTERNMFITLSQLLIGYICCK